MKPQLNDAKKPSRGLKRSKSGSKTEPVEVFCRLRPLKNSFDRKVINAIDHENLQVSFENQTNQLYRFKHIFQDNISQNEIFNKIGAPLVKEWFHGENGLLFTYGVTSAGKTYTITGTPEKPGLLPRVLDLAFNTLQKTQLNSPKYSFRSDGYNGFVVSSSSDIMARQQNDRNKNISKKTGDSSILGEWSTRERVEDFIKDLNHDYNYSIFVSYVENYNKCVYDLLDDSQFDSLYPLRNATKKPQVAKTLRENTKKQVYVDNLVEIEVQSAEEAFALFLKGNQRKKMGSTNLNADSSRSHSIFTLRLVQAPLNLNGTEMLSDPSHVSVTQLSIVDLAGCERTQRTGATGNRLKEASNINNSLLTLRSCLETLRENQKSSSHKAQVPYRNSRLTLYFKHFFEGGGKIKMVICLNPGAQDLDETLNVLKFGELSQEVMTVKNSDPLVKFHFGSGLKFHEFTALPLPSWPDKWLSDPSDDQILHEWELVHEQRNIEKKKRDEHFLQGMGCIRQGIVDLDKEIVLLREENVRFKSDMEAKEEAYCVLQNEYVSSKREKEKVDRALRLLQKDFDETKLKLSHAENHNSKLRNEYDTLKENIEIFFEAYRKETNKIVNRMMKNKEEKLKEMECLNKKKFEIAAEIFREEDGDFINRLKELSTEKICNAIHEKTKQDIKRSRKQCNTNTAVKEFLNEPDVSPIRVEEAQDAATAFSPNGNPVANPKFDALVSEDKEKWIDHRPPGTIELGTVMQPVLKNSKSVSELKAKDITHRASSKYVITHHVADIEGHVETQLFKGNVVPTAYGGAQVIFNDIEKLTQDSPIKNTNAKTYEGCTPGLARKRIIELEGNSNATTPIRSVASDNSSVPMSCVAKRLRSRVHPMPKPRWV